MTVERVLALLVHSRSARSRWRAGRLDVAPEVAAQLATLDRIAIESTAAGIRRHVLERTHTGVGRLVDAFPHTIAAWRARHPHDHDLDELAGAFLDSPAAAQWRETPGHVGGIALEQAFFEFAVGEQLGEPAARTREWLTALITMLAIDGETPAYAVPPYVRRRAGATWIIEDGDPPMLFATVAGRIMIGPVTQLVAALLAGAEPTSDGARAVQRSLHAMLWPEKGVGPLFASRS